MAYMGLSNHALYQVATKALIMNGDKLLVLETPDGLREQTPIHP